LIGRVLAFATIGLALPVSSAALQTVSGTVRGTDSLEPVVGAFVSLLGVDGQLVDASFSTATGQFVTSSPVAGRFQVLVEQIGLSDWRSDWLDLDRGEHLTLRVELERKPIALTSLDVQIVQSCVDDLREAPELATVWDEVRKALETARWAERQDQLSFSLTEFQRTLEPKRLATREISSRQRARVRFPPFKSKTPEQLAIDGYALIDRDSAVYYAPDVAALLSQSFQNTHCFGLASGEIDERPTVGITFKPRSGVRTVDIAGTIWLDQETAELRTVELRYENLRLPPGADRRLVGAQLTFARIPAGPFYVRDWWIRFPISARVLTPGQFTTAAGRPPLLVAYQENGGTVTNVLLNGRPAVEWAGASVRGTVFDSVAGAPLRNAQVSLRSWADAVRFAPIDRSRVTRLSAFTDSAGVFEIAGVRPGDYAIRLEHPMLSAARIRPGERKVVITGAESVSIPLALPSQESLHARLCPKVRSGAGTGVAVGFARRVETGVPVAGVQVRAHWSTQHISVNVTGAVVSSRSRFVEETSDADGRFVLCGIPIGETVTLIAGGGETGVPIDAQALFVWEDVPVEENP